jgi:aspartate aminotransferase
VVTFKADVSRVDEIRSMIQGAVENMVAEFRRRRNAFCDGLNELPGVKCVRPSGAFYAFANVTGTAMPSQRLADDLLEKAGVACMSGSAYGLYGEGYLRFSYANSYENLLVALDAMRPFLTR